MKHLGSLALLGASLTLVACENDTKPPTVLNERSQGVTAAPGQNPPAVSTTAAATTAPKPEASKPRAPLCQGQLDRPGKPLPKFMPSAESAPGAGEPAIPSRGRWTWINLWAAWCKPCKEEIPRLKAWEKELGGKLQVSFFSLDDDKRQLDEFLASQPPEGLRSSFWLKEGNDRDKWLLESGVGTDPDLPVHVLVDPKGDVRCVVRGAIEDADLPSVRSIVGG